jgi:hypothetical protein
LLRQNSLKSITAFIESGQIDELSSDVAQASSAILVVVKEYFRGFKETNVNIMKAIICLLIAVCEYHEAKEIPLSDWVVKSAADAAVQKVSDRKLTASSKNLLTALCLVSFPATVLLAGAESLRNVKSPIAHEEFLNWCQIFCNDFGANTICSGLSDLIPWILEVSFAGS